MKPKLTALFLTVFIFFSGVLGGVFLDRLCLNKGDGWRFKQFKKFMGPQRFDLLKERLQEKFTRELKLSLEQQNSLKKILTDRMELMKNRAIAHDQKTEMLKEETRQMIRQILSPEQTKRFNELVLEYQARQAKFKK